jgi:pimeloyl-ACP methyl ester carboxylesterase
MVQGPALVAWSVSKRHLQRRQRQLGGTVSRGNRPLHAGLDWYRASFRDVARKRLVPKRVDVPTLVVWGDRETHLDQELATPPADWVSLARVEHVPEAGHWVHHDAPEKVSALLLSHAASSTDVADVRSQGDVRGLPGEPRELLVERLDVEHRADE